MITRLIIYFSLLLFWGNDICSQINLNSWPKNGSPTEIGQKLTKRFLESPHGVYNSPGTKPHIPYFEVCTWYGALTFADLTHDSSSLRKLVDRFKPLFDKDSSLLPVPDHVDYTVFGSLPLEIYLQTKDKRYFDLGKYYADKQWSAPEGPRVVSQSYGYFNRGFSWQTRLWIDDMYMITLVQSQAYRATGDKKYIDRAAKEMVYYLDELQKQNGLFYHAPDAPFFWGRGNGWMAAGMAELLRALPKTNSDRPRIMQAYLTMMSSLLRYQSSSGMWLQLIDDPASWPETSSTAMFTYAIITGVKNGWLDKSEYGKVARKGWLALVSYINEAGDISDICEGTGKKNDRQYYFDRKKLTGDFHGQAPVLWCATAWLRKKDQ
jgi:rhamnogalacturonyl hydrolase YesR